MSDFWLQVLIQGIIASLGVSVAWGSAKAKAETINEKLDHTEQRLDRMENEAKAFSDRFVLRQEFFQALGDIKDQMKEARQDVKRVLEIISQYGK